MVSDISALKYDEALNLPKFKASLDRLTNKPAYDNILTCHHIERPKLAEFIEKAIDEGNAVLIEREWNTYCVLLWKD